MKIRKNYKVLGIAILSILIIVLCVLNLKKEKVIPLDTLLKQNYSKEYINEKTLSKNQISDKVNSLVLKDTKNINVSLLVPNKKYSSEIKEGSSVFEVMEKIEKESNGDNKFNFTYRDVAGMGSFITGINGNEGRVGQYWIYYVNDKKASVGVSNYTLKEGDIINWKQEGI